MSTTVELDPALYEAVSEIVENSGGFQSVEQYVNFALSELLGISQGPAVEEQDREALQARLRQLGYM